MKKLLVLLMVAALSLNMVACSNSNSATTPDSNSSTTAAEVQTMAGDEVVAFINDTAKFADALLIDVRDAEAYAGGHIEGSVNIALEEIESRIGELEAYKDKDVILYCNTGNRSGKAAEILVKNGFTKVYNAQGVKEYEYQLVTSEPAATVAEVQTMTGDEVVAVLNDPQRLSNSLIVDVRKADEYVAGHIPGAINIALEDFEGKLSELEGHKDKDIILYCNSGNRSGQAADILVQKGYANVFNAAGVKEFEYSLVK